MTDGHELQVHNKRHQCKVTGNEFIKVVKNNNHYQQFKLMGT